MTSEPSPSSEHHKQQRSERRALKSTRLALDHVRSAVQAQLTVLNECSNKIRDSRSERQLKSVCFATSNEIKRLQSVVCQLDCVVDRIPDHMRPIFSPEVQDIRDQITECIRQVPDLTFVGYHDRDPDQDGADDESSITRDLSIEDGTICDLEAGLIERRRMHASMQALCSDINSLNETVSSFSKLVQAQNETTNVIESNVNMARDRLLSGAVILSKISRNGSLPLLGAAIGTAVCGPIGMLLGYKVAAVACLGTATAGYLGGKVVEQKTAPPAITRTVGTEDEVVIDEERARDR